MGDISQKKPVLGEGNFIDEVYLGVQFRSGRHTITVKLELIFYPAAGYNKLVPEVEFTIREGPEIVGYGKVIEIGYW